jgi:RNA polymerase sigma-70 factor (ECF subfamily)
VAPSDAALLEGLRADDPQAFDVLYDRYAQAVYRLCWRRTRPPCNQPWGNRASPEHDPADLLSMVFLEAWRCRARMALVDDSLRPWLLGVATNVCRAANRHARRHGDALRRYHAQQATGDNEEPDHAAQVASRLDAQAAAGVLIASLQRLPQRQRDVAELCLLEGLSTAAASATLGVSEGTIKSRLARARDQLRRTARQAGLHAADQVFSPTAPTAPAPTASDSTGPVR